MHCKQSLNILFNSPGFQPGEYETPLIIGFSRNCHLILAKAGFSDDFYPGMNTGAILNIIYLISVSNDILLKIIMA